MYARKFGKGRLLTTTLYGPIKKDGCPDFETMAALTRQSASYSIIESFREAHSDMKKKVEKSANSQKMATNKTHPIGKILNRCLMSP